jgi:rod shape determining protein RodA
MREASPWRHLDPTVVLAALALATLGLLAIYSSTFAGLRAQGLPEASVMRRQLLSLGLGLVVMVAAMVVDYRRLQAWAGVVLGAVVVALGLVLTPLGSATNGAQSWFELGPWQVQPSEYAKVGAIVTLAAVLGARREAPGPRRLAAGLAATALICAEILLQPDFGTFLVFVAILFGVLLVSGVQLRWLLVLALVGVLGTVGMFKLNVLREYQKERLTAFIDPGADDGGRGFTYNSRQALIAIGSGGVGGKGYLRGPRPTSSTCASRRPTSSSPSSARSSASPGPWPCSPCSGCCSGAACASPPWPGTRSGPSWPPGWWPCWPSRPSSTSA